MKRSTKQATAAAVLDFSDFSGGLNLRTDPENIEQNELADCVNMTFSAAPGRLRTRAGLGAALHTFAADIDGMYWHGGALFIASAGTLSKYTPPQIQGGEGDVTTVGPLTGTKAPAWAEFGTELFIASGGKIQKYDGTSLTEITDSPIAVVGLYARAGRLFCFESDSDTLHGSAVGDASTWAVPASATDSDPCDVQIGYKVAGNIVAAVPSLTNVIIFKDKATFRLVNEYPDWTITEVSRDEAIANRDSAVNVAGYLFYLEKSKGVRLLQGTDGYEEIVPADTLTKVNSWVRQNLDESGCRIWNLRARNILLVSPGNAAVLPSFYEYGLSAMPTLKWVFPGVLRAVVEPDRDSLYVAVGKSFYDFSGSSAYDPTGEDGALELVNCSFSTKKYVGYSQYLLKRMSVRAHGLKSIVTSKVVSVLVNETPILSLDFYNDDTQLVYGNLDLVYENPNYCVPISREYTDFTKHNVLRVPRVQVTFESQSVPYELIRFNVEVNGLGVVS